MVHIVLTSQAPHRQTVPVPTDRLAGSTDGRVTRDRPDHAERQAYGALLTPAFEQIVDAALSLSGGCVLLGLRQNRREVAVRCVTVRAEVLVERRQAASRVSRLNCLETADDGLASHIGGGSEELARLCIDHILARGGLREVPDERGIAASLAFQPCHVTTAACRSGIDAVELIRLPLIAWPAERYAVEFATSVSLPVES